jgi:hypothetical protein
MADAAAKAALAVVPLVVVTALAELGGQAWFWHRYGHSFESHHVFHPHPAYVFAFNPQDSNWAGRPRDHDGFFHIPPLQASDGPRIWALGGSTTAAIPDGSDWPSTLQSLVAPEGVRVVNMGHGGWGTDQVHRLYRAERERVKPLAVVLHDGWNYRGASATRHAFLPLNAASPFDAWPARLSCWLTDHSALYAAVRVSERSHPHCGTAFVFPEKAEWEEDFRSLLSDMRGEDLHVVLYPSLAMREDVRPFLHLERPEHRCVAEHFEVYREEYEARMAVIEKVARAQGVDLLDVRPTFAQVPAKAFASLFQDFGHLEPDGNRLLAQRLDTMLRDRGVLPPRPTKPSPIGDQAPTP